MRLQTRRDGQEGKEREEGPRCGEDGRQDGEEGVQTLAEGGGERNPEGRAWSGVRLRAGAREPGLCLGHWMGGLRLTQRFQAFPPLSGPFTAPRLLVYPVAPSSCSCPHASLIVGRVKQHGGA